MLGGSTFVVTPKGDQYTPIREALRANRGEIAFGAGPAAISVWLTGSILPVLLIIGPAILCTFLAVKHNAVRRGRTAAASSPRPAAQPDARPPGNRVSVGQRIS